MDKILASLKNIFMNLTICGLKTRKHLQHNQTDKLTASSIKDNIYRC